MLGFIKKMIGGNAVDFEALKNEGAVIIDVRTPQEFNGGHVKGSINIPLQTIGNSYAKIRSLKKPIITCCASGMRSGVAARQLNADGIEAYNGGSWKAVEQQY